jgi:stress response protein YsnF
VGWRTFRCAALHLSNTAKSKDDLPARGEDRAEGVGDDDKLQLLAEELSITKEEREAGRVRISTRTHERETLIDENLAREHVEIETVAVGRRIDAVPDVRREGDTTIVPVVEEVLVVERQLMLKEEVRIKRVRKSERYQKKVILRHQDTVVSRHEDNKDNNKDSKED